MYVFVITADDLLERHRAIISTSRNAPISGWGIECGPGWYEVIDEALTELGNLGTRKTLKVIQIKEKMGGIRIYLSKRDDAIAEIIERAERKARQTCEVCGRPGKLGQHGAAMVRCDEHVPESPLA